MKLFLKAAKVDIVFRSRVVFNLVQTGTGARASLYECRELSERWFYGVWYYTRCQERMCNVASIVTFILTYNEQEKIFIRKICCNKNTSTQLYIIRILQNKSIKERSGLSAESTGEITLFRIETLLDVAAVVFVLFEYLGTYQSSSFFVLFSLITSSVTT